MKAKTKSTSRSIPPKFIQYTDTYGTNHIEPFACAAADAQGLMINGRHVDKMYLGTLTAQGMMHEILLFLGSPIQVILEI